MEPLEAPDQEIINRLNTAHRKVLVVGNQVFVPPILTPRGPFQFHVKQVRFLHHLTESGNDFDKACELSGLSQKQAKAFLNSREYKQYATEAIMDQAVHDGWTARRIVVELDAIYRGEKRVGDLQMEALKMLRDIIVPKKMDTSAASGVTVNLNFPPISDDARAKLKAIADHEATVVSDAA